MGHPVSTVPSLRRIEVSVRSVPWSQGSSAGPAGSVLRFVSHRPRRTHRDQDTCRIARPSPESFGSGEGVLGGELLDRALHLQPFPVLLPARPDGAAAWIGVHPSP